MTGLSFFLIALYLVLFPLLLFSPAKIQTALKILSKMKKYYENMYSAIFFTGGIAILVWGLFMVIGFLIMNMFTSGTPLADPSQSFLYLYTTVNLSHPALLVIYFIGVLWFFGTVVTWHRYFISSTLCFWYF